MARRLGTVAFVSATTLVAACLQIDPFGDQRVNASSGEAPGSFSVDIQPSPENSYHMDFREDGVVQTMQINGMDLLAGKLGSGEDATFETRLGIGAFQEGGAPNANFLINADGSGFTGTDHDPLEGPAHARIFLNTQHLSTNNNTTYDVFPSGRVVRRDDMTPDVGSDALFLTSYSTVGEFSRYTDDHGNSGQLMDSGSVGPDGEPETFEMVCLDDGSLQPNYVLGIAWTVDLAHYPQRERLRSRDGRTALIFDWLRNEAFNPANPPQLRTTYFLGGAGQPLETCDDVFPVADQILHPPTLAADGLTVNPQADTSYAVNGFQGGAVHLSTDRALGPGFAIELTGIEARTVDSDASLLFQTGGGSTFLWFPGTLAPGDTLTFEPR